MDDVKSMPPGGIQTKLAPTAQLIEADCGKGTDQGEAGGERVEQRYDVVTESRAGERETNDGIDQAKEDDVRRHRPEILKALCQRCPEISQAD